MEAELGGPTDANKTLETAGVGDLTTPPIRGSRAVARPSFHGIGQAIENASLGRFSSRPREASLFCQHQHSADPSHHIGSRQNEFRASTRHQPRLSSFSRCWLDCRMRC